MNAWEALRRRKLVQWGLAYLAGAWVVIEATSLVGSHFGWPNWIHQVLIILAAAGFLVALVVAWYHGEQGRQRVSGPELLMVAALLVVAGLGIRLVVGEPGSGDAAADAPETIVPERSVAVLPLDNLSADGTQAFFAQAMTEEITSALTAVPELTVTSRNSAAQFDESGLTVREFARSLGVSHVVEGSVQRAEDRVRITVQLIDARTDQHRWSETYERELEDLFELQADVAEQVAQRLAASFTTRERERILSGATDDPLAYDLYLRANAAAGEERVDLLRQALDRDPSFGPAWEALAWAYVDRDAEPGGGWADSARSAFDRAVEVATNEPQRLRIEAYRGLVLGEEEEAQIARLRAAAEERPSDVLLVAALGEIYRIRGRLPEAVEWLRQAALLDPLQRSRWMALFTSYWWMGLFDRAERVLDRATGLDPLSPQPWASRVWFWLSQDRPELALAAVDTAESLGSRQAPLLRVVAHWWSDDPPAVRTSLADLDSHDLEGQPVWLLLKVGGAARAVGDSTLGRRIIEDARATLEAREIPDFDPEWRVFPRLQLAALDGRTDDAVALFRLYVERGGRDPRWFRESPMFAEMRQVPAFASELEDLERRVQRMRREMAGR